MVQPVGKWYPKLGKLLDGDAQDLMNVDDSEECWKFFEENWGDTKAHFYARLYFTPAETKTAFLEEPQTINAINHYKQTPLLAFAHGCWMALAFDERAEQTLDILLSAGADVNASDNEGLRALHYSFISAAEEILNVAKTAGAKELLHRKLKLVEKLIEAGADRDLIAIRDKYNINQEYFGPEIKALINKYGLIL